MVVRARRVIQRTNDGERERWRQMRGTAEEEAAEAIIAPPSSAASAPRKKRALIVWGAAHDAVLAQIDASRRTHRWARSSAPVRASGHRLWAGARAAPANVVQRVGAGVGRKRASKRA